MYQVAGMGGYIACFGADGSPTGIGVQNLNFSNTNGLYLTDNSSSGINITENGSGGVHVAESGDGGVNISSSAFVALTAGTQRVNLYTADTMADLNAAPVTPSFGYSSTSPYFGGSNFQQGALYSWNNTYSQWGSIPQNVGYLEVRADYNGTATFNGDSPVTNICPYYPEQPTGLVSNASPTGYAMSPLAILSPGTSIQVYLSPHFTLLATGNAATPNWDYIDTEGTLIVWDAAGTNLLAANWNFNGIQSDTANFTVNLTQNQLIGTDLSLVSDNQILTTTGGIYNISIQANCSWD